MREMLFRGKRKTNGEWIYGDYFRSKICNTELGIRVVHSITFFQNGEEYSYCIDPDTIGQYTGLTDKNGNKIFEGDILFCTHEIGMGYREFRGKVVYKAPRFFVDCGNVILTLDYDNGKPDQAIIGNIYDNPELLEVEK